MEGQVSVVPGYIFKYNHHKEKCISFTEGSWEKQGREFSNSNLTRKFLLPRVALYEHSQPPIVLINRHISHQICKTQIVLICFLGDCSSLLKVGPPELSKAQFNTH